MKSFYIFFIISSLASMNLNGQIYYTIGSTKEDVMNIQGIPSKIEIFADQDLEVLIYGKSRVSVSLLTNKLISYNNSDSNLRIKLMPGKNSPKQDFLVHGSDLYKIIMLNGTPKSYIEFQNQISILYGESILNFNKSDQKILASIISNSDNIKIPNR